MSDMARKLFRYASFFVLILVLLISVAGASAGQADPYIIFEQAPLPADKIDPALREDLAGEGHVEVLVKMTRQVDISRISLDAGRGALSGNRKRAVVCTAVVEKLRANAASGQKNIIRYLEQEQGNGSVLEFHGYYIVNMLFIKAAPAVVEQIARRSDVKLILPNTVIALNAPGAIESGDTTPPGVEWGLSRINTPDVWALGFDGEGVVVGIIDSGADWQHEAIKTKWRGYNPAAPGNPDAEYNWYDATSPKSALPKDAHSHGTHVTGTVLGATGTNKIGVAPGARWIAARVFDGDGYATVRGMLDAGQFMLAPTDSSGQAPRPDLAPQIINCSWGSENSGMMNEWFRDTVQAWRSAGILPVFAAGNEGKLGAGTILNPASYPESLAVAAIDSDNGLADFSSRGPGYLEGIKPEISAPGVSIRSSLPGGGYGKKSGTSMAAPHISGVAALVLSANPDLDVDHLEQAIIDTAVPLTNLTYLLSPNYGFGYGLVDALSAVSRAGCGLLTGQILAKGVDYKAPATEYPPDLMVQPCGELEIPLLPASAAITVLETGAVAVTDPDDGAYRLWHPATGPDETLTLQVTAPGFKTEEIEFSLAVMETKVFDFILEPSSAITAGDLNGDGTVNVADAIILLRSIVGLATLEFPQLLAADVNLDGMVDVADAVVILRYIVGLVSSLPV